MKHQTPTLPKFKKLKRRLRLTKDRDVMGLLESLWLLAQKSAPRGDVGAKLDNEDLAIELEWDGDANELVDALVDTRWLDRCDEHRLLIHDWPSHAPRYIHGIVAKKGGFAVATTVANCSQAAQSTTEKETLSDCTAEQPNLTQPNLTQSISSEVAPPPSKPILDPSSCRFPDFPCISSPGYSPATTWQATPEQLLDWQEIYPAINVTMEIRRAHAWVMANLGKRKTAKGMASFLNKWFARQQDQASQAPRASPGQRVEGKPPSKPIQRFRNQVTESK